jgi:hypothetical protein
MPLVPILKQLTIPPIPPHKHPLDACLSRGREDTSQQHSNTPQMTAAADADPVPPLGELCMTFSDRRSAHGRERKM